MGIAGGFATASASSPLAPEAYLTASNHASPVVAYALDTSDAQTLGVSIEVEAMNAQWPQPQVEVGLAAQQAVALQTQDAQVSQERNTYRYAFTVKRSALDRADPMLAGLRFAFTVAWINPAGQAIQRENFLMSSTLAPSAPLGKNIADWQPFSLEEYNRVVRNISQQIRVRWEQPVEGKATVVINNSQGQRVRNLVRGQSFSEGRQTVVWDGLDDAGNLVDPGNYEWEAVTHPGITPEFLMSYYNPGTPGWNDGPKSMWLGDHSAPQAAASNGKLIALGCPLAESGNNIVIVDQEGNKLNHANTSSFMGHGRIQLAMDDTRFYAFCEGAPSYNKIRKDEDGNEYVYASLNLIAWNLEDGREHRYRNGRETYKVIREYKVSPDTTVRHAVMHNLRGATYLSGTLVISLYDEDKVLLLNPDTGEEVGEIPLPKPGAIASDGQRLLVFSGDQLVLFDRLDGGAKPRVLFSPELSAPLPGQTEDKVPVALELGKDDRIYVADDGVDQTIKVYDFTGKQVNQLGRTGGGVEEGEWLADSVRHPYGIALDDAGQLWVAENHFRPKRISIWNAQQGTLKEELFGPSHYGASGAGFDTADITKWLGGGAAWNIDIDSGEVEIDSVLFSGEKPGIPTDRFYPFSGWYLHKDGRTFILSKDNVMRLYEVMPDKHLKLWAMYGTLHAYEAEAPRWWVPTVFTQHPRLKEILADFTEPVGPYDNFRNGPKASKDGRELSIMWIDRNGDDVAQVEELQVAGDAAHQMRGSIWGYHSEDTLDWKLFVQLANGEVGIGDLRFQGWLPSGAPDWDFEGAVMNAQAVPGVTLQNGPQSFLVDSRGRFLLNSHPMYGISPDNQVEWTYPNDWTGVHGSHKAPLPETGVLQGSLSYLGSAPFDDKGDVTIVNGNHGRFFVMTTDGIYLDEMFQDVRLSRDASAYRIGGECFGGYFGRDKQSGRYILQSGHSDYRIFEIHGLDQVERQEGPLKVTPEQITAAQKLLEKAISEKKTQRIATITQSDAKGAKQVAEWGKANSRFPYANVVAYREGADLVLRYTVNDPSPWVNNGKDRNLLFKTGDVAAFEFSTNPQANPKRSEPAVGDKRLLIAPFEDSSIAILYDYRVPGTTDPVLFNSPWRTATVDDVTVIEEAQIDVKKDRKGYVLTVRLPLAKLGLPSDGGPVSLLGDFGVIYGDEAGNINVMRSYWSNPSTGLVNDVPGETMINPSLWGQLEWK